MLLDLVLQDLFYLNVKNGKLFTISLQECSMKNKMNVHL